MLVLALLLTAPLPAAQGAVPAGATAEQQRLQEQERQALADLRSLGLRDVVPRPLKYDHPFTYWDYRAGMFHKNLGMRIDLVYAAAPLAERVSDAYVDREARKGKGASDHAPVVLDIEDTTAA